MSKFNFTGLFTVIRALYSTLVKDNTGGGIVSKEVSDDVTIKFKNGSYIKVLKHGESARGNRAKVLTADGRVNGNTVPIEKLLCYAEYVKKQEGKLRPCSNQIVTCAVVTHDMSKALSVMDERGATITRYCHDRIEWNLNNERWIWRRWSPDLRGYRFSKVLVDADISEEIFEYVVIKSTGYCCSMELI